MSNEGYKHEICRIGQRLYQRGFAAGNDGNLSCRLSETEILCTPTMISKGFMTPEDLCTVDLDGNQLTGTRGITSEIRLHLAVYRARPDVRAVVHCHPPYATAFGMAREPIPAFALPEVEMQLGEVPVAKYATPGTQEFADTVLPYVHRAHIVVLANHGTISWGDTVERAFWKTELLDAYCRKLLIAKMIGNIGYITPPEAAELLAHKQAAGLPDPRFALPPEEIYTTSVFQEYWADAGLSRRGFSPPEFEKKEKNP